MIDTNLAGIWSELENYKTADESNWRSRSLNVSAGERSVLLALDETSHRHLLVPQGSTSLPTNTHSPLAVSSEEFRFGSDDVNMHGKYLDIRCQLAHLNPQFDTVVIDVVNQIQESTDPATAAFSVVNTWRRLFTNLAAAPSMSYRDRVAAFGELTFLQELYETQGDFQASWWTGPEKESHDFVLRSCDFEVKTIGDESEAITIHGLSQLAEREQNPLYIIVRKVVEDSEGRSVGEVLTEITSGNRFSDEIREKAALFGVSEGGEDSVRFEIVSTQMARVTNQFPRITSDMLEESTLDAVRLLKYDLALYALRPYLEDMSLSKIGKIVNG